MRLTTHILLSFLLALCLFPLVGYASILVFISGFVLDIDHWFWYALRFKDLNPRKCRRYCYDLAARGDAKTLHGIIMIFHSIELVAVLLVLSFFYPWAALLMVGAVFHMLLDYVQRKAAFGTFGQYSLIVWLLRRQKS